MSKTAFCTNCGCKRAYTVRMEPVEFNVRGGSFRCRELRAFCVVCNNEVYVPEINDANARAREETFSIPGK
ncbi:hypothetical protein [Pseudoflavonifractor phocaeensis]|uniref:hypothetical protein n=1 Tax=Pseudoflavonifractor phocaeensis TaxID=1870988 RepID=UPI00195B3B1D|nr:hypothetical protein [Pseudoflavonifractor phocaeensis]MBM6725149.1 hypothetical protein [Pseudoflavonifractor phocaeensis]